MSDEKEKKVVSKSFSRSLEGSRDFTGTLTYQQKGSYDEILADSPDLGMHSNHFPSDCVLQTLDANSQDGNLWTVVCKFFKRAVETSKFKHGGPAERNVRIFTKQTNGPIINLYRYRNIPEGFRAIFEKLSKSNRDEKIFPSKTDVSKEDYVADDKADAKSKITIRELFEKVNKNSLLWELYQKIAQDGIKNVPSFHFIIEETEIVKHYTFPDKIGKICKPSWGKIPELPWGGNWILDDEKATFKENIGAWERVRTFKSAEFGEMWDEKLYSG